VTDAEAFARAQHDAFTRAVDTLQPAWEGLAVDLRRNRVAAVEQLLADGWQLVPPG